MGIGASGYLELAKLAAPYLSSMAKGRAEGRQAEAGVLQQGDQLANQQFTTQQNAQMQAGNLDLQRRAFADSARGSRGKQALIADMIGHYQPTSVSVPGITNATIRGGLHESIGDMGKASMAELSRQALLKLMEGDEFQGGQMLTPPKATPLPQSGKLDTFLNTAAGISGLAGSLSPFLEEQMRARHSVLKGAPEADPNSGAYYTG